MSPSVSLQKNIIFLLMICSFVLALICIHDGHNWGGDFALYISQAQALLNGSIHDLYVQNKFSMQHSEFEIGPYLYPFGFPSLLSPVLAFSGLNFIALKIYCALFFTFSLLLIYRLFCSYLKETFFVLLIIAAIAFHDKYLIFTSNVLSDLPFFFFCFLSFTLMEKKVTWRNSLLLGLCLSFTWFIRDIGIVLFPSLLILQLIRRIKWKEKTSFRLLILPYLIFTCFAFIISIVFPAGTENHYQMLLRDVSLESLGRNNAFYFDTLSHFFMGAQGPQFLIYPLLIFAFIGVVTNKSIWHFSTFCILTWFVLILWPSVQGERFLFPIIPFLLLFFVKGIVIVFSFFKNAKLITQILLTSITLILCFSTVTRVIAFSQCDTNEASSPDMKRMYQYISENTKKSDLIAFFKPQVLRLFTERNAVLIYPEHFLNSDATYMLAERGDFEKLQDVCIPVFASGEFLLFTKR